MNEIFSNMIYIVLIAVITILLVLCFLGIKIALKVQKKQTKKLNELKKIVNENSNITFQLKDSLTPEDIKKIDSEVSIEDLMKSLYDTYLTFLDRLKNLNTSLDDILTGYFKEFYVTKIESLKQNKASEVIDGLDLIGYSISEYDTDKLKFRININCFNYKMINNKIVSGSNLIKVSQIIMISYEKTDGKWLISKIDKVYEKKLSN